MLHHYNKSTKIACNRDKCSLSLTLKNDANSRWEIDGSLALCMKSLTSFLVDCDGIVFGMAVGKKRHQVFKFLMKYYIEVKFISFLLILYSFFTSLLFSQER